MRQHTDRYSQDFLGQTLVNPQVQDRNQKLELGWDQDSGSGRLQASLLPGRIRRS